MLVVAGVYPTMPTAPLRYASLALLKQGSPSTLGEIGYQNGQPSVFGRDVKHMLREHPCSPTGTVWNVVSNSRKSHFLVRAP